MNNPNQAGEKDGLLAARMLGTTAATETDGRHALVGVVETAYPDVKSYARLIRKIWARSAKATLEAASIIAEARAHLEHPSFSKLAEELGAPRATLSKFITIHSRLRRCARSRSSAGATVS
jgi:hypothetical protein